MTLLLRIELVHDRQSKRAAQQIGQAIGTEYPISSVKRLRFMLWSSYGQSELQSGLSPGGKVKINVRAGETPR